MARYVKTTWAKGDIITAAKLNHAEDGIAAASKEALLFKVAAGQFTLETGNAAALRSIINAADLENIDAVNDTLAIRFSISILNSSDTYTALAVGLVSSVTESSGGVRTVKIDGGFVAEGSGTYKVAPGNFSISATLLNAGAVAPVTINMTASVLGTETMIAYTGEAELQY